MKIIRTNKRICVEGRDIASKILAKNPKYDVAFYFKCSLEVAAYRRWLDLKKSVPPAIKKSHLGSIPRICSVCKIGVLIISLRRL